MFEGVASYWSGLTPQTRRMVFGIAAGIVMPVGSAIIASSMDTYLHVRAPSMTFLCSVILAALFFGRRVAVATAFFAFFVYNFYLTEPRNTFGFAGFEDILTLLIFVTTALVIGGLAGRLHDQRDRAEEQVRIFSGLFTVSRAMAESTQPAEAMRLLVNGVCDVAASAAAIVQLDEAGAQVVQHASPAGLQLPDAPAAAAHALLSGIVNESGDIAGWRLQLMQAGGKPSAVLVWKPSPSGQDRQHAIAVRLLTELTHVAMERSLFLQRQLEMETFAATEKLRTALMSSISHDFRTPLSTILTSASSLLTYGDKFSEATRADLAASIQEEAERLNRFVSNILDMTRVDAGVLKPRDEWIDPLEVLENIEERMRRRLGERQMTVEAPAAVPSIFVDPLLLEQAVVNVIENALVHTPPSTSVRLGAEYTAECVRLWVEDEGPGVPLTELSNIFDKFRRLANTQNTQGAGLGLAISKGFVEAMRGQVAASSPARDGRGLRVEFIFPLQTELATT
jgi:two-component system, OmpR family, sensor histidine kinase KdpD